LLGLIMYRIRYKKLLKEKGLELQFQI